MGKRSGWRRVVGNLVLVNLRDGRAIKGRLVDYRGNVLTVAHATLYDPANPEGVGMDGAQHVGTDNVGFVQDLAGVALPAPASPTSEHDGA